jgi:peptidyl-prolyl cis-trans isomerase A (cyclophilin A)
MPGLRRARSPSVCRALALWSCIAFSVVAAAGPGPPQGTRIIITTKLGDIEVELDATRAPITVANFLRYVNGRFYDDGVFHRTVRSDNQPDEKNMIEVVQGGINPARRAERFPPIALERTKDTGIFHVDGAISMARGAPDTAQSDFFICLEARSSLDFGGLRNPDGQGFAAFGRVVAGLEVARRIQRAPAEGQRLTPAIRIVKIARKTKKGS